MEVEFEGVYAVGNRTRGRMKSECIKNTYSLMKYKNDPSNPIIIDIDVDAYDSIRITPIPTIAKVGVMTQRSKSKLVSTVKPIHKEGQHSEHSVSVEVLHEIRSKQKFDPDSNPYSPVHGYTKSDFEDPNPFISQNKRKSPPLVTAKVVQHQEKKARVDVANPQAIKAKVKSRNWRTENQRREFMWSMGTCDVSMLSRVSEDLDLSDIDWCSYVLECLKNTKHAWNSMSDTSYYVGPIVLLTLIYLEHVSCDAVTIDRGRPVICLWDVETMHLREEYEIRNGGIGSGELQDPYIPHDDNAENVNSANGSVEEYLPPLKVCSTS
ncbi:unnamed protein product [Lactuca saligna]|uniref:Uncharacterized protein n=1 Tax=Lactuca saligna TaxID=75948 RepID=A0AA35YSA2_LACSI|nr:unnamed protein product [Lactuca saligna]